MRLSHRLRQVATSQRQKLAFTRASPVNRVWWRSLASSEFSSSRPTDKLYDRKREGRWAKHETPAGVNVLDKEVQASMERTTILQKIRDINELKRYVDSNIDDLDIYNVAAVFKILNEMDKIERKSVSSLMQSRTGKLLLEKYLSTNLENNPGSVRAAARCLNSLGEMCAKKLWEPSFLLRKSIVAKILNNQHALSHTRLLIKFLRSASLLNVDPSSINPKFWDVLNDRIPVFIDKMPPYELTSLMVSCSYMAFKDFPPELLRIIEFYMIPTLFEMKVTIFTELSLALGRMRPKFSDAFWKEFEKATIHHLQLASPKFAAGIITGFVKTQYQPSNRMCDSLASLLMEKIQACKASNNDTEYIAVLIPLTNAAASFENFVFPPNFWEEILRDPSHISTTLRLAGILQHVNPLPEEKVDVLIKSALDNLSSTSPSELAFLMSGLSQHAKDRVKDPQVLAHVAADKMMVMSAKECIVVLRSLKTFGVDVTTDYQLSDKIERAVASVVLPPMQPRQFNLVLKLLVELGMLPRSHHFWSSIETTFLKCASPTADLALAHQLNNLDRLGFWDEPGGYVPSSTFFDGLSTLFQKMTPRNVASVFPVFESLKCVPPDALNQRFINLVEDPQQLVRLSLDELTRLIWCGTKHVTFLSPQAWSNLEQAILHKMREQDSLKNRDVQLIFCVWAFVRSEHVPSLDFWDYFEAHVFRQIIDGQLSSKDIKYLALTIARLGYHPSVEFWSAFENLFIQSVPTMAPFDVASSARAISGISRDNSSFAGRLSAATESIRELREGTPATILKKALERMRKEF